LVNLNGETMEKPTKRDVIRTQEFCNLHETAYPHHKCEPIWDKNGNLERYNIIVNHRKVSHIKPRGEK
jgi:hypothetical protein